MIKSMQRHIGAAKTSKYETNPKAAEKLAF